MATLVRRKNSAGELVFRGLDGGRHKYGTFCKLLFSRIVPCVKDIGLWGERLQKAYLDMGVFDLGVFDLGDSDLDLLMTQDEEIAEALDRERFAVEEQERVAEVAEAIAEGGAVS